MSDRLAQIEQHLQMAVAQDGTVIIPPELYEAMGWQIGEKLIVQVKDGEMKIFSQTQAIQRAQAWVKSFVPNGRSLSDELIAERRAEHLYE
jgi:bifunctional DNA-binding transcriptional regulator/antitoxin component of YhaV-PrlF toxin-antitoxin module